VSSFSTGIFIASVQEMPPFVNVSNNSGGISTVESGIISQNISDMGGPWINKITRLVTKVTNNFEHIFGYAGMSRQLSVTRLGILTNHCTPFETLARFGIIINSFKTIIIRDKHK
jgi:hypothetical protein